MELDFFLCSTGKFPGAAKGLKRQSYFPVGNFPDYSRPYILILTRKIAIAWRGTDLSFKIEHVLPDGNFQRNFEKFFLCKW